MGHWDGIKGIRHKEVCVLKSGLMHVYYLIYFYYLLLFVIYVLSLEEAWQSAHVFQPKYDTLHLS